MTKHKGFASYTCHKQVEAAEVVSYDPAYNDVVVLDAKQHHVKIRLDRAVTLRGAPKPGDFLVQYADGYLSLSPRDAFLDGYTLDAKFQQDEQAQQQAVEADPNIKHDFGFALAWVKAGRRVARAGWNGKGMFIFLVPGSTFKVNRPPLLGIYPEGTEVRYHGHIDLKAADGMVVPWNASQADVLAEDWELLA